MMTSAAEETAMTEPPPPPPNADRKFLLAVGALLLTIILLLSGLFVKMRRQVIRLKNEIVAMQNERSRVGPMMQLAMDQHVQKLTLDRDKLPTRKVVLDGRTTRALRVSAAVAERVGLAAGDVVIVDAAPATAPASQPAGP